MPPTRSLAVADALGAGVAKALLGKAVAPRRPAVRDRLDRPARHEAELGSDAGVRHAADGRLELPVLRVPARGGPGARRADRHRRAHARHPLPDGGEPRRRQRRDAARAAPAPRAQAGSLLARADRARGRGLVEADRASARSSRPTRSTRSASSASSPTRLPDGAILTSDSGSAANWFARDVKIRKGMMASLSGTLATMGPGVPYAIAAKFAYPDRPVIALVGDGAMQMNGINELITIAKYWQRWPDPRLVVLVLNNRDLNQVTWEQRAMAGDPKFEGSQDLPDFPYARYAELLGLKGIRVDRPDRSRPAWDEALAADRPVVIEAVTDPEVPPLPPHITIEQAKALSTALIGGDPNAGRIVRQSFKQKVQEFLPGPMTATATRVAGARSRSSRSAPTRSRPTRPRPTARSRGTRRRSSSSTPRRRRVGARLHVRGRRDGEADRVEARRRSSAGRRARPPARWAAMVARFATRPSRHRVDGDRRRRHGALGPEGAAAGPAAVQAARNGARPRAGLRHRRLHVLLARPARRAARRLGASRGFRA